MTWKAFRAAVFVVFLAANAMAATGVITVDVKKGTVDPPNPIVNVAAADAVEVRIVKDGVSLSEFDYDLWTTVSAGRTYVRTGNDIVQKYSTPVFRHNNFVLNTKRCGWKESRQDFNGLGGIDAVPCPSILLINGFATIYSRDNSISVNVVAIKRAGGSKHSSVALGQTLTLSDQPDASVPEVAEGTEAYIHSFTMQLVGRGSNLFFSLGMTWFGNRDAEYVLQPSTTEGKSRILFAGYGGPKYQVGANAHYSLSITRAPLNHASVMFGLSTEVPVDSLSAYLGLAVTAWTLPSNNSGHIFVGVGYSKADRLAPEFRNVDTVASSTAAATLVRSEYRFGVMAGVSFSFFGGEDKFKAVFPGSSSGGEAKSDDKTK